MLRIAPARYALFFLFPSAQCLAQSFLPDPSFSDDGLVVQEEGDGAKWRTTALATTSDGGSVTSSVINRSGVLTIGVSRYDPAGQPLATFGSNGIVEVSFGTTGATTPAIIERPDGRVDVVCINYALGTSNLVLHVVQLLPDGTMDPSWGDQGTATHLFQGFGAINDIVVRPQGELVLCGSISGAIVAIQLTINGQPDPAFGIQGIASLTIPGRSLSAMSMALAADGTIYLGGYRTLGMDASAWAFGALGPTGAPLPGFGVDGITVIDNIPDNSNIPTNANEFVASITLDPYGQLYFGASAASTYGDERGALGRLLTDGTLDASYASGGVLWFRPDTTKRVSFSGLFYDPTGRVISVAQECQGGGCMMLLFSADLAGSILDADVEGGFTRDAAPFSGSNYAASYAAASTLEGRLYFAASITGASFGRSVIKAFVLNNDLTTDIPSAGSQSSGYRIAPNPCNGSFTLAGSTPDESITTMRLFNARGSLIMDYSSQVPQVTSGRVNFDLPGQATPGLYQLVLSTGSSWTSLPLVVE